MPNSARHLFFLEELCNNIGQIGIKPQWIDVIIKEPLWKDHKVPDIIIRTKRGWWYVIELKGNIKKRSKAKRQIEGGIKLLKTLGVKRSRIVGVFVVYSASGYQHERIDV